MLGGSFLPRGIRPTIIFITRLFGLGDHPIEGQVRGLGFETPCDTGSQIVEDPIRHMVLWIEDPTDFSWICASIHTLIAPGYTLWAYGALGGIQLRHQGDLTFTYSRYVIMCYLKLDSIMIRLIILCTNIPSGFIGAQLAYRHKHQGLAPAYNALSQLGDSVYRPMQSCQLVLLFISWDGSSYCSSPLGLVQVIVVHHLVGSIAV